MKKRLLRIVNTNNNVVGIDANRGIFAVEKSSIGELDSKVIIHVSDYKKIFGNKKKDMPVNRKRLCVVKITSEFGRSIYRECFAHPMNTERCAAVTRRSFAMLDLEDRTKPLVDITKGSWWAFYWHHPVHATRISTRLSVIGIAVSIIVTLLTVIV